MVSAPIIGNTTLAHDAGRRTPPAGVGTVVDVGGEHIAAERVRLAPAQFQPALARARAASGIAWCHCCQPPLRLVIRKRSLLHLAAWPDEAALHARECPFRANENEYLRRTPVAQAPLPQEPPESERDHARATASTADSNGDALTLWPLIHHLWEHSGLYRWQPGWRRDWALARKVLLRASEHTQVDGQGLRPLLYIPPVFTPAQRAAIDSDYAHYRNGLGSGRGFLLGQVRSLLDQDSELMLLRMRHHAPPVVMHREVAQHVRSVSPYAWQIAREAEQVRDLPVMALLHVQPSDRSDLLVAVDGVLMTTSQGYVPVRTRNEAALADRLIAEDRTFFRPLSYARRHLDLPAFVLTDAAGELPVELVVAKRPSASTAKRAARTGKVPNNRTLAALDRAIARGALYWLWDTTAAVMPELPARATTVVAAAPPLALRPSAQPQQESTP